MESHGNGVVDFGRFLTGFFVVMGIGTSHASVTQEPCPSGKHKPKRTQHSGREGRQCIPVQAFHTNYVHSSSRSSMALGANRRRRSGHVRFRWSPDICHHYQLHYVFPGARRLLTSRTNIEDMEALGKGRVMRISRLSLMRAMRASCSYHNFHERLCTSSLSFSVSYQLHCCL